MYLFTMKQTGMKWLDTKGLNTTVILITNTMEVVVWVKTALYM